MQYSIEWYSGRQNNTKTTHKKDLGVLTAGDCKMSKHCGNCEGKQNSGVQH